MPILLFVLDAASVSFVVIAYSYRILEVEQFQKKICGVNHLVHSRPVTHWAA